MSIERRTLPTQLRGRTRGKGFVTKGHAATYNQPYDLGSFSEQIAPGAFDGAIESDDVRALWNHDSSNVLGRTKAGTLRLSSDKVGLFSEIDFPATAVRERESVERGDVDQMSFGFSVVRELWEEDKEGRELRTILEAKLFDVSPVAFPANAATDLSVAQRSLKSWRAACPDARSRPSSAVARRRFLQRHDPAGAGAPSAPVGPSRAVRRVALHEAAHAVAFIARGHEVTEVRLTSSATTVEGAVRTPAPVTDAVPYLAGASAERLADGVVGRLSATDRLHSSRAARKRAEGRLVQARQATGRWAGDNKSLRPGEVGAALRFAEASASSLVTSHRAAISAVAEELCRKRHLTGSDVERVMRHHPGDRRR